MGARVSPCGPQHGRTGRGAAQDKKGLAFYNCHATAKTRAPTRWHQFRNLSAVGTLLCPQGRHFNLSPRRATCLTGHTPRGGGGFVLGDTELHTPPGDGLEAPCAFNDQRFAVVLQFIAHIAFCRGLPQCTSQEIHCEVPYGNKKKNQTGGGWRPPECGPRKDTHPGGIAPNSVKVPPGSNTTC